MISILHLFLTLASPNLLNCPEGVDLNHMEELVVKHEQQHIEKLHESIPYKLKYSYCVDDGKFYKYDGMLLITVNVENFSDMEKLKIYKTVLDATIAPDYPSINDLLSAMNTIDKMLYILIEDDKAYEWYLDGIKTTD